MLWFRGANKMRNEGIRLGEQRSQVLADVIDRINKTSERWNNRLTIENTRFIDRYEGGELQILIEFSVGIIPKQYVLILQGTSHISNAQYPRIRFRRLWEQLRIYGRQMHSEVCGGNHNRQTVFVDNAKAVQTPENISLASCVWFDSADRVYSALAQSLYFSKSFGFVFRGSFSNREITPEFPGIGSTPEGGRHIVQCSSQVLQDIPNDSCDRERDWLYVCSLIRRSLSRIYVTQNVIWPDFQELVDSGIQIRDVMVGPFDFDPD